MKMRTLLFTLLCLGATAMYGEARQALVLHTPEEDRVVYYLEDEPEVTFDGQKMTVSNADGAQTFPMDNIAYWTVEKIDESGVLTNEAVGASTITVNGTTVKVTTADTSVIAVYDMSGRLVDTVTGSEAEFSLSQGIYIVTAAGKSYKIVTR